MTFLGGLNRRHKAGLFLTVLVCGTRLVSGASAKETAGIVLLGLAFTWAFGANNRLVHGLFALCGLLLVLGPLASEWNDHRKAAKEYQENVAAFERRIPYLPKIQPQLPPGFVLDDPATSWQDYQPRRQGAGQPDAEGWQDYEPRRQGADQPDAEGWQDYKPPPKPAGRKGADIWGPPETIKPDREALFGPPAERRWAAERWGALPWFAQAKAAGVDFARVPDYETPGVPPQPFLLGRSFTDNLVLELAGLLLISLGLGLILGVKSGARRGPA